MYLAIGNTCAPFKYFYYCRMHYSFFRELLYITLCNDFFPKAKRLSTVKISKPLNREKYGDKGTLLLRN